MHDVKAPEASSRHPQLRRQRHDPTDPEDAAQLARERSRFAKSARPRAPQRARQPLTPYPCYGDTVERGRFGAPKRSAQADNIQTPCEGGRRGSSGARIARELGWREQE
jgi:hypothetical protein